MGAASSVHALLDLSQLLEGAWGAGVSGLGAPFGEEEGGGQILGSVRCKHRRRLPRPRRWEWSLGAEPWGILLSGTWGSAAPNTLQGPAAFPLLPRAG